ncbi:hypothetical protein OF83DRAFT_1195236 [Amylostereum chailletii]|nr:hypothetical protein OF83DRAFT_1195236 [Amylostereum chailletii]
MADAAKLKEEGNAFFVKKDYSIAMRKYTQAIELDKRNAVLYSNRAACHLALQTYNKAIEDAQKAVEIDPGYSKAWARLATAEDVSWQQAVSSWERALETFPNESLTPVQTKQRAEYEAGLEKARARFEDVQRRSWGSDEKPAHEGKPSILHGNFIGKKKPGQRAVELLPRLTREGRTDSSVSALPECHVLHAHHGFVQALESISLVRTLPTPMGMGLMGRLGGIESLSNALMVDNRCFYIADPKFPSNLANQSRSPCLALPCGASILVRVDVCSRTHNPPGRRDCSVLVCRAYIEAGFNRTHAASVRVYDVALDVLTWGRNEWPGVPAETRGTIFEDTFVRGVRNMRLEAYMEVCEAWVNDQRSTQFTLEGLLKEATELVEDVRAHPVNLPGLTGFNYAFGSYVEGHALSMQALYWNKKAREGKLEPLAGQAQFRKAAELYLEAANCYPEDDEQHLWFTKMGLDILFGAAAPLKETMPIMARIRRLVPAAKEIWELSQLSLMGMWQQFDDVTWFEKTMQGMLDSGRCTLEDMFQPNWADTRYLKR